MKCPNCGKEVVRFPVKDEQGKIIWKNLFKMDWMSVMFLIAILFMTLAYIHDTKQCNEIIENPIDFCKENNYCKSICENQFNGLEKEGDLWQFDIGALNAEGK